MLDKKHMYVCTTILPLFQDNDPNCVQGTLQVPHATPWGMAVRSLQTLSAPSDGPC